MIVSPIRSPIRSVIADAYSGPEGIGGLVQWDELLAWWGAESGITVTGSGVSAWVDRKRGYTLVQDTDGARPAYSATGFNGTPGLTFDGTADNLRMESQPFPSGANPCEVWLVVQQDALVADTGVRVVFSYGGSTAVTRRVIRRVVTTGVNRASVIAADGATSNAAETATAEFSTRHLVRAVFGATETSIAIDGGVAATVGSVPATGTARVSVGSAQADTAGSFWNGKIRDVIVTSLLSAEKAALLETFLLSRRNL